MTRTSLDFCRIFVFFLLLSVLHIFRIVTSNQVVLLDTDVTQWVNWTSNTGWRQQSLPNTAKRVYGVCRLTDLTNDHWLRSPFVPRGDGVSMHVELHFTMRECRNYPNPTELRHCGDTLGLYYRESLMEAFRKETVIAPDRKWLDSSDKGNHMNVRTIRIKPAGSGIYIALRDTGSCVAVYRVRLYYHSCPERLVNFTRFPATPAGHLYDVIDVTGRCVAGAEMKKEKSSLSFCKADGTWHDAKRAWCQCKAGHEPVDAACEACNIGQYKSASGLSRCESCPRYSSTNSLGSTLCLCNAGHYRNPGLDDASAPCTRPPSKPQKVRIVKRTDVTVVLSWLPPEDLGGRDDLLYYVSCAHCPPDTIFAPSHRFSQTNVSISHLTPNTAYQFTIHAVNGVSDLASSTERSSVSVNLHTESRISKKIKRVQVDLLTANIVLVSWEAPLLFSKSGHKYELRFCSHSTTTDCNLYYSNTERYRVTNLTPDTAYSLQVRVQSPTSVGEYSDVVMVRTLPGEENSLAQRGVWSAEHVVYVVVPLVVVCVCFIVMTACIVNRRKKSLKKKELPKKVIDATVEALILSPVRSDTSSARESVTPYSNIIFSPSVEATRCYVDPQTYEDLTDAIRDFTQEIDASWVTIDHVIGGGEFGDVCKGVLNLPGRCQEIVAVKTLKADAGEKSRADFLLEASIMGQFRHSNVIRLLGVVTKTRPAMIVTEFMENGSLDKFLRSVHLTTRQRLEMLRGVASGMEYLASMGFVHRDLAARNVLVDLQRCCKVSDFGLSRVLDRDMGDEAYVTRGGKIPVRWTAPEAINFRKYTSASDVWSFGIVAWEIFSSGERPYWEWTNHEVIQSVNGGYRLPQPDWCPDTVYRIMMRCWDVERCTRPSFMTLVSIIDDLIDTEVRRQQSLRAPTPNVPLLCPYTEVEVWLGLLGLERYSKLLRGHGIYLLNNAFQLNARSLYEMGVQSDNDRRALLESIHSVRVFVDKLNASDGCFV